MASVSDEPIASTSQQNGEDISREDIEKLMQIGKKHYVNKEATLACEKFEEACSKLATKYGQTSNECGEAYFYYGKSLLDIARAESDVLGNAVPKDAASNEEEEGDEEMEEDTEEEETNEEEKQEQENIDETDKENGGCKEETKAEDDKEEKESKDVTSGEDKTEDEKEEGLPSAEDQTDENEEEMQDGEEGEKGKEENPETKDDVTNMQLAWEMLELSRIIFARQESKDMKLKQAEANLALGEIGMELEHYPEAIGDFMECLRIQEQVLQPDNRLLAETFYNLGLAYSFDRHYGKSIEYFNKAIKVIQLRISNLTEKANENDNSTTTELNELKDLIPDITAKVEDAEYMKKSTEEIIKTAATIAKESLEEESESAFDKPVSTDETTDQEVKVSNIGHLVRKKRKTDDEEEADGKKKSRTDEEQKQEECA